MDTGKENGAEGQTCTGDARIFSPALYYLSYLGKSPYFTEKPNVVNRES